MARSLFASKLDRQTFKTMGRGHLAAHYYCFVSVNSTKCGQRLERPLSRDGNSRLANKHAAVYMYIGNRPGSSKWHIANMTYAQIRLQVLKAG